MILEAKQRPFISDWWLLLISKYAVFLRFSDSPRKSESLIRQKKSSSLVIPSFSLCPVLYLMTLRICRNDELLPQFATTGNCSAWNLCPLSLSSHLLAQGYIIILFLLSSFPLPCLASPIILDLFLINLSGQNCTYLSWTPCFEIGRSCGMVKSS